MRNTMVNSITLRSKYSPADSKIFLGTALTALASWTRWTASPTAKPNPAKKHEHRTTNTMGWSNFLSMANHQTGDRAPPTPGPYAPALEVRGARLPPQHGLNQITGTPKV